MKLWLLIAALWVLYAVFFSQHTLAIAMLFGVPAFFLTLFAIFRGVIRWLGRQFRGDYKKTA